MPFWVLRGALCGRRSLRWWVFVQGMALRAAAVRTWLRERHQHKGAPRMVVWHQSDGWSQVEPVMAWRCRVRTIAVVFELADLLSPFAVERLQQSLPLADEWLASAPRRLLVAAQTFGVTPVAPLWGGNRSVACWGTDGDGVSCVVKLAAYPGSVRREVQGLRVLAPSGRVPRIVAVQEMAEVLVTELISQAVPLAELPEHKAEAPAVAELLSALHGCAPGALRTEQPVAYRLAAAWRVASAWRSAPRVELAAAAEVVELLPAVSGVVLHGDLVPANILRVAGGKLMAVDPQAVVGDPASSAAAWALLRGNGDEQGWRAGGGGVRRALHVGTLLGCSPERVMAHLSFQAFELACRQASWGQWDWVSESMDLARAARAVLS